MFFTLVVGLLAIPACTGGNDDITVPSPRHPTKAICATRQEPVNRHVDTQISDGPVSRQLIQLVGAKLPNHTRLLRAGDTGADPSGGLVSFGLANGQNLTVSRLVFPREPGTAHSLDRLVTDPTDDRVERLPSGSRLARIGHDPANLQVVLVRPGGTRITAILSTPSVPIGDIYVPDPCVKSAFTLGSLTGLIRHHLDTPTADS